MKSQKALEQALRALEADRGRVQTQQDKVETQIAELRAILGRGGRSAARTKIGRRTSKKKRTAKKKRRLSAAGRRAISEAMKKSWAARRKKAG